MMYHVNPVTKKSNICRARKRPCKYGADNHYNNRHDAIVAVEKMMETDDSSCKFSTIVKKKKNMKIGSIAENSYLDYGFKKIDKTMTYNETRDDHLSMNDCLDDSEKELAILNDAEKSSLRFFTSSNFKRVNSAIYHQSFKTGDSEKFFVGDNLKIDNSYDVTPAVTKDFAKEVTGLLDSALDQAPREDRIVYRGMSENYFFEHSLIDMDMDSFDDDIFDSDFDMFSSPTDDWVKKNVVLGETMHFDGYQSTSLSSRFGEDYAGPGGVIFEIKTPEGLNVTSVSCHNHEKEVVLPRDSHYMVVGLHKDVPLSVGGKAYVVQLVAIDDNQEIITKENKHQPKKLLY